ncbi:Uncharacterized protein DBV15_03395 [Temnothorax longispinosus]|uniref:Uncharacterized protein n=1 Tax=Temnothorax longispinosus TaxID=300112 RepID=A0A4S2KHI9_9HYME|nr:Uncharacterized protein DBV15_03395 [Temnothorax longispinosus]
MEGRENRGLRRVGKKSDRVASNEVTTRTAGGRQSALGMARGATDSFDLVEASTHHDSRDHRDDETTSDETVLCGTASREEKECHAAPRAVGFSIGGIFHLCQPPLDAPAAPARLFSRIICRYELRHHRVAANSVQVRIRDRATVLTITKKRGYASGKMTRRRTKELLWSEGVKRADT